VKVIDVTEFVDFGNNDEETLPITMCVCGARFKPWDFYISIYKDEEMIDKCPVCGAKLFFGTAIRVYQLSDLEEEI